MTQDLDFVAGPAIFGFVATAASPVLSLACCGALIAAGALAIDSAAAAPVATSRAVPAHPGTLLRLVAPLAAVMAAIGAALGTIDVLRLRFCDPARAAESGRRPRCGVGIGQPDRRPGIWDAIVELVA